MLNETLTTTIRDLYQSTSLNQRVFDTIRTLELNQDKTIVIDNLLASGDFSEWTPKMQTLRSNIADLFRSLAENELGRFVIGRRGHPSRFVIAEEVSLEDILTATGMEMDEEEQAIAV